MIGILADRSEMEAAAELFELFKTPCEPCVPSRHYAAVLSTRPDAADVNTDLLLVYAASEHRLDRRHGVSVATPSIDNVAAAFRGPGMAVAEWGTDSFPLYGRVATFGPNAGDASLRAGGQPLEYRRHSGSQVVWRFGYDLLREVDHLLRHGQPLEHAKTATLEIHIALMRRRLLDEGYPLVEIPPRPSGYDVTCCLTHDVDFYGVRRHRLDKTLAGFAFRASLGSVIDLLRGRRTVGEVTRNMAALVSLPLVHTGLLPDFWRPFDDYAVADGERPSTFFVVPFKGRPGVSPNGETSVGRAVPYGVAEIRGDVARASARGVEIATHGIDAWRDASAGAAEMQEVMAQTGQPMSGVRMHWLYFDARSGEKLEAAGFIYDSTCGYNEAVGFRAGTAQVFKLPGTKRLLELPLAIMDTSLFYPSRMGLSGEEGLECCREVIAQVRRFGGSVVVNWHERSLAPERLWTRWYRRLLETVDEDGRVWFATARSAVEWFAWRRSIRFETAADGSVEIHVPPRSASLPAARLVYRPVGEHGAETIQREIGGGEVMALEARSAA